MLILSIAGGIAFSYKDFITDNPVRGNVAQVLKGNWNSFFNDYRLIKPKTFGFKGHAEILDEEERRFSSRVFREFSIEMTAKNLEKHLISAYT